MYKYVFLNINTAKEMVLFNLTADEIYEIMSNNGALILSCVIKISEIESFRISGDIITGTLIGGDSFLVDTETDFLAVCEGNGLADFDPNGDEEIEDYPISVITGEEKMDFLDEVKHKINNFVNKLDSMTPAFCYNIEEEE